MILSVLSLLLLLRVLAGPTAAQDVVFGVNVVNPMRASVADQNAVLSQLEMAPVHVIRCGISNDDKGIDYAKRALTKGIRVLLGAEYPAKCVGAALPAGTVSADVGWASAVLR